MCACTHSSLNVRAHATDNLRCMDAGHPEVRQELGPRAWGALLHVHADLVPALDRQLQGSVGLPLAWYDVLLELDAAPGRRLRMGELGEKVVLSRTRVSRLVAELTALGAERLRAAAPVYLAGIDDLFSKHLTDAELDVLGTALWRVHGAHEPERTGP